MANKLTLMKFLIYPFGLILTLISLNLLGQVTSMSPAEHEKNEGVLLVWDYNSQRDSVVANIAGAVQNTAKAWIIYYPGPAPMDTTEIRQYLLDHGVGYNNVHFIPGWTETLWIRDYGPFTAYGDFGEGIERYMMDAGYSDYNRPMDDSIPSQIAGHWNMQSIDIPLEFEGGNILLDGLKNGFTSTRVLDQNPAYSEAELADMLSDYFSTEDFIFLEELENSGGGIWGHVDMYIKIIDYETIMVSKYPEYVPDYELVESIADYLGSLTNYFGEPYEIVRINVPPNADGNYPVSQDDEMRTYTNSLTMNDVVVVPAYGLPEFDTVARNIYREVMPGYDIQMVDAQNLTPLYGAIHCITKEVPQEELLRIIHKKLTGPQPYAEDKMVFSSFRHQYELDSVSLYYRKNNEPTFTRTDIHQVCPEFYGVIPNCSPGDTIDYYIEAKTDSAQTRQPLSAPDGYYTFWFNTTTGSPGINAADAVTLAPNPNGGTFFLKAGKLQNMHMEVFAADGQLIHQQSLNGNQVVHLGNGIQNGVYLLRLTGNDGRRITKKLLIR